MSDKSPKTFAEWLHEWREWIFWPLAGGAVLMGILGIQLGIKRENEFVKSLGEAFLIAGFLAMTVDQYVKKKLLREVSSDVSKYLIGYELPAEAQDRIKELMSCKIMRENYEAHYKATHHEGRLRVEVTISYDVKNITHHNELYRQHLALEDRDTPVIISLECNSKDSSAAYSLQGRDFFMHQDGVVEAFGPEITIRPANNKEGFEYHISDTHSVIQAVEYADLISFRFPTINVKITSDFPPDVTFWAPPPEPAKPAGAKEPNSWEYRKLFMPTEHIRVRWYKNK